MKITKSQLKQIIKEELGRVLQEQGKELPPIADFKGGSHRLVVGNPVEVDMDGDPIGEFEYQIDGKPYTFEFHTGWFPQDAAEDIFKNLGYPDDDNQWTEEQTTWFDKLEELLGKLVLNRQ